MAVPVEIDPEPSETEREAILAALAATPEGSSEWASAALLEGVGPPEDEP